MCRIGLRTTRNEKKSLVNIKKDTHKKKQENHLNDIHLYTYYRQTDAHVALFLRLHAALSFVTVHPFVRQSSIERITSSGSFVIRHHPPPRSPLPPFTVFFFSLFRTSYISHSK